MKILVTGAKGFIGKNLIASLRQLQCHQIFEYDIDSSTHDLDVYCNDAEFVFHLAGVNRPIKVEDYMKGNFGLTSELLETLKRKGNKCPVMLSSSIQAEVNNPYGLSKKAGEDLLFNYGIENNVKVLVYRFPNVFGKWCKPNYNSVIATFAYNISRGIPIMLKDPMIELNLVYIDDVISELINALDGKEVYENLFCQVAPIYKVSLGKIAELLFSFKDTRKNLYLPNMDNAFEKKLYATYLSYIDEKDLCYDLRMNVDARGSFTEFVKSEDRGQISVNFSKPGIIKGNHWHNTKNEKFLVVSGRGVIRLRRINSNEIIEYSVSGEKLQVIDIPPGYTHNIENTGDVELVTIIWANEVYDASKPDTYYLGV